MSFFSIISHASQIHRTRFCVEHKRSNRECLFYSSLIPTTSKNDNFYIVRCVHMCVSEAHARWMCDCVCIRVYVCVWVCLCYRCRYVSLYCCSMLFGYEISTQERECDKYDNITDIFLFCLVVFYWKFEFYILVSCCICCRWCCGCCWAQLLLFFLGVSLLSFFLGV